MADNLYYKVPPGWDAWADRYRKHVEKYTDQQALIMRQFVRDMAQELKAQLGTIAAAGGKIDYSMSMHILAHLSQWESEFQRRAKELANQMIAQAIGEGLDKLKDALDDLGASLPVEEVESMIIGGPEGKLLLERIQTSMVRYSGMIMEELRRTLAMHMALGSDLHTAVQALTSLRGWPNKAYWQGERVVRTEVANAYNRAVYKAQEHVSKTDPTLWLVWWEHAKGPIWGGPKNLPWPGPATPLDDRVADDSLRLHGQARKPGQLFCDPQNPTNCWPHPPNRPNDRATLVVARIVDNQLLIGGK